MDNKYEITESPIKVNEPYHKGQRIVYKGEDAHVIEVKPVFIISMDGKYHVICGNILDEIRPSVN